MSNQNLTATIVYNSLLVNYKNFKWWQFRRKRTTKAEMRYYYPLMKEELFKAKTKNSCESRLRA